MVRFGKRTQFEQSSWKDVVSRTVEGLFTTFRADEHDDIPDLKKEKNIRSGPGFLNSFEEPVAPELLFTFDDVIEIDEDSSSSDSRMTPEGQRHLRQKKMVTPKKAERPSFHPRRVSKSSDELKNQGVSNAEYKWIPKSNNKKDRPLSPMVGKQIVFIKNTKTMFRTGHVWTVTGESGSQTSWRIEPTDGVTHLAEKWRAIGTTVLKKKEGELWKWNDSTCVSPPKSTMTSTTNTSPKSKIISRPRSVIVLDRPEGQKATPKPTSPSVRQVRVGSGALIPGRRCSFELPSRELTRLARVTCGKPPVRRSKSEPVDLILRQKRDLNVLYGMLNHQEAERKNDQFIIERLKRDLDLARKEISKIRSASISKVQTWRNPRKSFPPPRSPFIQRRNWEALGTRRLSNSISSDQCRIGSRSE